ncbi:uncharacterized protein DUF1707 [Stackebrandtia endophytica]|uniref:Uncharacterized protein DUF1707 n=2 Tax=Stackebrandtia endophytica TaxID=1496996 RepID=A0A543AYL7_9ACTN|nr:uncharacterized protein DUF1707 [Stackebrandtia endophytica]
MERSRIRISNSEREQAIARLQASTSDGRLTLDEFTERSQAVYEAKTFGELQPLLSDLPQPNERIRPASVDSLELAPHGSSMVRNGQWVAPSHITLRPKASSMKLDFTNASIAGSQVDIDVDARSSAITLVLPKGSYAEDSVALKGSSLANRVPYSDQLGGVRFVLNGRLKGSSITIRHRRRFLWWTY